MRLARLGLLVCGAALFVWLLATIGPRAVLIRYAPRFIFANLSRSSI